MKVDRKEFGMVNVEITVSDNELRLWACNENGESVLRIKAQGKVHCTEEMSSIIVVDRVTSILKGHRVRGEQNG